MVTEYLDEMKSLEDFDSLYKLKCQKDSVVWSGFEREPEEASFKQYVQVSLIDNPNSHLFLLKDVKTSEVMGYCQFNEEGGGVAEGRGSGLFKKFQGCGLASVMDTLLVEKARDYGLKYMYTWCSENNIVSVMALIDAGFTKTTVTEKRFMKVFNEEHTFYKWEIYL